MRPSNLGGTLYHIVNFFTYSYLSFSHIAVNNQLSCSHLFLPWMPCRSTFNLTSTDIVMKTIIKSVQNDEMMMMNYILYLVFFQRLFVIEFYLESRSTLKR